MIYRPKVGTRHVHTADLREHRRQYQLLGPGCLCPLLVRLEEEPGFIEAAIYMPVFGCYGGEYVAACARNCCGYVGQSSSSYRSTPQSLPCITSTVGQGLPRKNILAKNYDVRGEPSDLPRKRKHLPMMKT